MPKYIFELVDLLIVITWATASRPWQTTDVMTEQQEHMNIASQLFTLVVTQVCDIGVPH